MKASMVTQKSFYSPSENLQMQTQESTLQTNRQDAIQLKVMRDMTQNNPRITAQRQAFTEALGNNGTNPNTNNSGMPDNLKAGLENLSGFDLSDVKVHYNSAKPFQLQALAYAKGNEIHLGPGQEKHLPHEGWHVVQQRQGKVRPTLQMKGVPLNDDSGLEKEADIMGAKAFTSAWNKNERAISTTGNKSGEIIQRVPIDKEVSALVTHLVEKDEELNSIYEGEEKGEVEQGDIVTIETSKKLRSRRGPNQELFRKHDEFGAAFYRWFNVLAVNTKPVIPNLYIRDDVLSDFEHNLGGRESMLNLEQRKIGSHKLVRFEVWKVAPNPTTDAGHLIMYDYHQQQYFELSRNEVEKTEDVTGGTLPAFTAIDRRSNEPKTYPYEGITPYNLSKDEMVKRQSGKLNMQKTAPKYKNVDSASVILTNEEYLSLLSRFNERATHALFHMFEEAQTEALSSKGILVTRCLSILEDLALQRELALTGAFAHQYLKDFIDKAAGVTPILFKTRKVVRDENGVVLETEKREYARTGEKGERPKRRNL